MTWVELRQRIPNALTIARFAAIPVFAWLYLEAGDGPAWGRALLRRCGLHRPARRLPRPRWHVESSFGKVADPLADRLMIGTAVVLTWATGRIPLVAALVILARDLALIVGYRTSHRAATSSMSRSSESSRRGSYASLGFVLVTDEGTGWPLVLLWLGIALAIGAGVQYLRRARSSLHRG